MPGKRTYYRDPAYLSQVAELRKSTGGDIGSIATLTGTNFKTVQKALDLLEGQSEGGLSTTQAASEARKGLILATHDELLRKLHVWSKSLEPGTKQARLDSAAMKNLTSVIRDLAAAAGIDQGASAQGLQVIFDMARKQSQSLGMTDPFRDATQVPADVPEPEPNPCKGNG